MQTFKLELNALNLSRGVPEIPTSSLSQVDFGVFGSNKMRQTQSSDDRCLTAPMLDETGDRTFLREFFNSLILSVAAGDPTLFIKGRCKFSFSKGVPTQIITQKTTT